MSYLGQGTRGVEGQCQAVIGVERCTRETFSTVAASKVYPEQPFYLRIALCRSHYRQANNGEQLRPIRQYAARA